MIPAEAVEAAAKAWINRHAQPGSWTLEENLYAALEAAAPHLLRVVWDEAYGKGFDAGRGEPGTPNPYEEAL